MKLFKNIMSRKPEPEEAVGKIDFDMDVEPLCRRRDPVADDTGERNAAALGEDASTGEPHLDDPSLLEGVREEEPEEAAGAGWGDNAWEDDDWDEDEDWGDDEFEEFDDNPNLKENIREAMGSMNHIEPDPEPEVKPKPVSYPPGYEDWSNDEEFGRKAIARSHLGRAADDAEDRILERTDTEMTDRETSRRRSATET